MYQYSDLRRWRQSHVDSAVNELVNRVSKLNSSRDEFEQHSQHSGWEGDAAENASTARSLLLNEMDNLIAELDRVRTSLIATSDDLADLANMIEETDAKAAHHSFKITDDGMVVDRMSDADDIAPLEQQRRMVLKYELKKDVDNVREEAGRIDRELSTALNRILDGEAKESFTTFGEAYGRYLSGSGKRAYVNINSFLWPDLGVNRFLDEKEIANLDDGTYLVGPGPEHAATSKSAAPIFAVTSEKVPISPLIVDLDGREILGSVTMHLNGTLTKHGDTWEFTGYAAAYDDYYDFDVQPDRGPLRNIPTIIGGAAGEVFGALPGTPDPKAFPISINGVIPIQENGTLPN